MKYGNPIEYIPEELELFRLVCEWCDEEFLTSLPELMCCSKKCYELMKADFNGEL